MTDRVDSKSLGFLSRLKCPVDPVDYRNPTGSDKPKFNRGNSFRPVHMPDAALPSMTGHLIGVGNAEYADIRGEYPGE